MENVNELSEVECLKTVEVLKKGCTLVQRGDFILNQNSLLGTFYFHSLILPFSLSY